VVANGVTGILSDDLRAAALAALKLDRNACREHALRYTWEAATQQFIATLTPVRDASGASACRAVTPS
jgi:hypothetical protein